MAPAAGAMVLLSAEESRVMGASRVLRALDVESLMSWVVPGVRVPLCVSLTCGDGRRVHAVMTQLEASGGPRLAVLSR